MLRKPFHIPSTLSLLLCLAGAVLWVRGAGTGDHFGWKRQQSQGREWVHEEYSARSTAGRVEFLAFRKTTGGSGDGPPKAQIRSGEEGFFWTPAVEKAPVEKSSIDIQKVAPKNAPPAAAAPADAHASQTAGKPFRLIDESTPTSRVRGVSVAYWLLVAVTALLPLRWIVVTTVLRRDPAGGGNGGGDRVPLVARLFSTAASLSILLAFALGLVWAKSWHVGDRVSWRDTNKPQFVDVHSGKGELVVHYRKVADHLARSAPDLASAPNGFHWRQDPDAGVGYTPKTFCFEHDNQSSAAGANRSLTVAAPYWFLMILALVMPTWWLRNQKYGPIKVTSFGRPAGGRHKGTVSAHANQRPI